MRLASLDAARQAGKTPQINNTDWSSHLDEQTNHRFYVNHATGESQWEPPATLPSSSSSSSSPLTTQNKFNNEAISERASHTKPTLLFSSNTPQPKTAATQVSEPSERDLRKTRILAMDLAKWLQTATSTTKLTHSIRIRSARSPPPCSIKILHNLALLGAAHAANVNQGTGEQEHLRHHWRVFHCL